MTTLVLIALAAITARLIFIYTHPVGPCRRCRGKGTNPLSTKKRSGYCRRCHGARVTQRTGSKALHRMVRGTSNAVKDTRKKR
jgi:DnaJ-class molecular chaperone